MLAESAGPVAETTSAASVPEGLTPDAGLFIVTKVKSDTRTKRRKSLTEFCFGPSKCIPKASAFGES
jgi:hypothetical protein